MSDRSTARLAWVALGCSAWLVVADVALSLATGARGDAVAVAMLCFPVVGALIASRQPRNAIAWIMIAVGVGLGLSALLAIYARYALIVEPGSLPRPDIALALNAPMWVPFIGLPGTFLILLFPDGRLPSPRWRPLAWLCAIALIGSFVGIPIAPGSLADQGYPGISNPLGIEALRPVINALLVSIALIPICIVACAAALIQRFRRSHGQERLQLKWLALGAGATAVLYLTAMVPTLTLGSPWDGSGPAWLSFLQSVAVYSFMLIPVAVGIAVLRHRLYDIDVVVNRALVYGALSACLAGTYLGGVLLLQQLFAPLTRGSDLAIAGSTLAVAALFRPLRSRIQRAVDRRFFRGRYDAAQIVETFSARLRDRVDLDALGDDLRTIVSETMQPAHVSLWLRGGEARARAQHEPTGSGSSLAGSTTPWSRAAKR